MFLTPSLRIFSLGQNGVPTFFGLVFCSYTKMSLLTYWILIYRCLPLIIWQKSVFAPHPIITLNLFLPPPTHQNPVSLLMCQMNVPKLFFFCIFLQFCCCMDLIAVTRAEGGLVSIYMILKGKKAPILKCVLSHMKDKTTTSERGKFLLK